MNVKLYSTYVFLLISLAGMAQQKNSFTLSGIIKGKDTGSLYLVVTDMYENKTTHSAQIRNGKFEFKGTIPHPMMAFVSEGESPRSADDPNSVSFFLDLGETVAELQYGDFKNVALTGAKTQDELNELAKLKKQAVDRVGMANIDLQYILNHPDSYAAVFLLRGRAAGMSMEDKQKYLDALSPTLRQSGFGRYIKSTIDILELGVPGTKAIDFVSVDINGDTLRLADYKGQYVLLDFWASWCVPCRKGNPHLLETYAKYKAKGFEIIGVSDDDSKPEAWHKAVEKDEIGVWRHVLRGIDKEKVRAGDINFRNHVNEISNSKYGVTALPTKILIDPSGNIIGRYGGGDEDEVALDEKLANIFESAN